MCLKKKQTNKILAPPPVLSHSSITAHTCSMTDEENTMH